ncbi:MAG: ABC transporter substrate-binding protein [Casimicrobiaceae bacterium]
MSKIDRRQFLRIGGGAMAGSLLAGTGLSVHGDAHAQAGKPLLPVRLTCGANLGYSNLFVAEAAGLFQKHGIDGRVILFDVAFQGTEAVISGQAETASTVEFPLVNYLAKGADLVVPAVTQTADDLKIVALNNIAKPEDLVGKRVGFIFGSSAHYGFDQYMKRFKLPADKVKTINVPAAEQVALFAKGDLDAYVWVEPAVSRGLDIMKGKAHILSPGLETAMKSRIYLQFMRAWAEKNPQGVIGTLRALIEANEFTKKNPAQTGEIAGKKLNLPAAQVPELLKRGGWDFDVYLDASLKDVFAEVIAWMKESNRLAGAAPNIMRAFDPAPLRSIDPARVKGF